MVLLSCILQRGKIVRLLLKVEGGQRYCEGGRRTGYWLQGGTRSRIV